MQIKKMQCESTEMPKEIEIRPLSGGLFEFIGHQNIDEENIDGVSVWKSNMTHIVAKIDLLPEMIAYCVKLRYSVDDEMALINKGIVDSTNAEYIAYRTYVSQCKEACK